MATKSIAWNTGSGNITLTYNGQGDGPISIQTDANNGSVRSQVITVETVGGAITRNLTISQAACPFPVGDVRSYSYTGSYQEAELPAGQYKLQCWGAQGGSNAAASSYGITAQAGGKGGYSEGIITLTQKTTVRVYVGGQGSSSAGGFNGGGSTSGSASYNSGNEQGVSRMGGGGGASDIRLSDGALLSRMIVAGGGAGGAMCYKDVISTDTTYTNINSWSFSGSGTYSGSWGIATYTVTGGKTYAQLYLTTAYLISNGVTSGKKIRITASPTSNTLQCDFCNMSNWSYTNLRTTTSSSLIWTVPTIPSTGEYDVRIAVVTNSTASPSWIGTIKVDRVDETPKHSTSNGSQIGGVGGGTQGGAYSSTYAGKQNAAGSGGAFGQGAAQSVTNYRYCSGAGGGGWYGGGSSYSDNSMTNSKYGGGGSGFVNTDASAGNRPSGYTGLQLDSGETKAGNTSFPSTSGGTETGHSGNGYAKITRLA